MDCLEPIELVIKRQGTNRLERRKVPCGKCVACLSSRSLSWTFRLKEELKVSSSAFFVTLTYDEAHLPIDKDHRPIVKKRDFQNFMKRLRKNIPGVRFFAVSEYGPTGHRPHYHALIFNLPLDLDPMIRIERAWQQGWVKVDYVNDARIRYVAGYCLELSQVPEGVPRPWMLCSTRPAIGDSYLTQAIRDYYHYKPQSFVYDDNVKLPMPRYYKDRLYNLSEKSIMGVMSDAYRRYRLESEASYYDDHDCRFLRSTIYTYNTPTLQKVSRQVA